MLSLCSYFLHCLHYHFPEHDHIIRVATSELGRRPEDPPMAAQHQASSRQDRRARGVSAKGFCGTVRRQGTVNLDIVLGPFFTTISAPSSMPPQTRHGTCSTWRPCLSDADWCLQSDAALIDSRLQVLFLKGGRSPYLDPNRHGPLIKHHFPRATVATLQDAGHWVHWDQPAEFVDLVLGVLDR